MKTVEAIADDEEAKKKMEELFKLRSGMTVDEMVKKVQEGLAEGYLFPEKFMLSRRNLRKT